MSATNRGAIRAERDYYRTPNWAAHACVDALGYTVDAKTTFMDPCAGDGVFGDAVLALSPESFLVEIDIEPLGHSVQRDDFLVGDSARWGQIDWVIGNPPYSHAEVFLRRAWEFADEGVAFLLRLGFLAGQGRAKNLYPRVGVPDVYVLPKRPSFTPDGKTDAADYAWFVWPKRRPVIDPPRLRIFSL